jgi:hypothetical protein
MGSDLIPACPISVQSESALGWCRINGLNDPYLSINYYDHKYMHMKITALTVCIQLS